MNIWILYYSNLFLHISILYHFIFFNYFLFFGSKNFKKYIFLIITDGYTDGHNSSVYSREFETIYFICHNNTVTSPTELFRRYFIEGWNKITINATTNHRRNNLVSVLKRVIFFCTYFSSIKSLVFFFIDKNDITDERFPSVNLSVKLLPTEF
jgi:hypothetical protein